MKTSEILNLDYYENKNIFQKALKQIKPFSKCEEEIPFELLEKFVAKCEYKYNIMINYICPVYIPDEKFIYSATIRETEECEICKTIFSCSLYELYIKISIYYYSLIKAEKLTLKDWSKKSKNLQNYLKERAK